MIVTTANSLRAGIFERLKNLRPQTLITGEAGSGKSVCIRKYLRGCFLTATTGTATANLMAGDDTGDDATTINTALGYGIKEDLSKCREIVAHNIAKIAKYYRGLVIDEISMMKPHNLQVIAEECAKAKLPLVVVGDFAQLPPVQAEEGYSKKIPPMAFEAPCWKHFRENTIVLPLPGDEDLCRHKDPMFKAAVDQLRVGRGDLALPLLLESGVKFVSEADPLFKGATLFSTNNSKNAFNANHYVNLRSPEVQYVSCREGTTPGAGEIPQSVNLKVGAEVMLTDNLWRGGRLIYANGDKGKVIALFRNTVKILRERDGLEIDVEMYERKYYRETGKMLNVLVEAHWDGGEWVEDEIIRVPEREQIGKISFMPLEWAWAVSFHRSQGLTFDAVQATIRGGIVHWAAMIYVAVSRCRTGAGLTLIGNPDDLVRNCGASIFVHNAGYLDLRK